jgi:hypothetical protein
MDRDNEFGKLLCFGNFKPLRLGDEENKNVHKNEKSIKSGYE